MLSRLILSILALASTDVVLASSGASAYVGCTSAPNLPADAFSAGTSATTADCFVGIHR
jgi:hypothetical protein